MSTNDVPGFDPKNAYELATGCWAEHNDGSLIFVESTEDGRVIYSIFDLVCEPPLEYRDVMPEKEFKNTFSWQSGGKKSKIKWTWHDKAGFPWDRVIRQGVQDGIRLASADDQLSAAAKIAESMRLKACKIVEDGTFQDNLSLLLRKPARS